MKIRVALNKKSIAEAKKKLLEVKKKLKNGEMINDLLNECVKFIEKQTAFYLDNSGIGSNVIEEIKSSWHVERYENKIIMRNTAEKAVYVEFGVGIVGGSQEHPNADKANYEYNVPSPNKLEGDQWMFLKNNLEDLDLPQHSAEILHDKYSEEYVIITQGTKGVWYAFNAIEDLKMQLPNIWKEIKERHIG